MEIRDPSSCGRRAGKWHRSRSLAAWLVGALVFCGAQAWAQPSTAVHQFRVVGGLAGISQSPRWEEPFWTRELPRISGGRFRADIVPFDRAGVPGEEMLRLVQLGVVPFGTALLRSEE